MLFRRQREPGWMAIRIDPERIDVAHVVRAERPVVMRCESYQRTSELAQSLASLRKALRLDRYHCTTLVDPADYQVHLVDAPNVPASEMRLAVRWSLKDLIDYPIDAATIDVAEIPGAPAGGRPRALFAVTARNEAVAQRVKPFQDGGVTLAAVDIPEMAQRNLNMLFEPENRAVGMLAFYPEGGLLTITGKGELLVARRIEVPLSRLLTNDAAERSLQLDRIALELQRSLDNFDRQFSFISLACLKLAFVPSDSGLHETLKANLDVPVEAVDLTQVMDCARVPELNASERQAQCMIVLGAALRSAPTASSVAVAA